MTAFKLPEATRLGRVRLQVADLTRSLAWYESVLGLRAIERGASIATLAAHGDDTPLVELNELTGAAAIPPRGRLGLYHFAILLPDRPALGRFIAHLAKLEQYAGMSDHLVSEALYLTDPDGLGIEVYADRPRNSWQRNQGELVMSVLPLDAAAVVKSANGVEWSGMPAGTVIGHVHLYVADIAQAASFYAEGLGFERTMWSYPGALFMSAGGYHHHLGTNTWSRGAPLAKEDDARLLDWEILVPDAADGEAAARNLESAGYAVASEAGSWRATDPWGTTLRLRVAR